MLKPRLFRKRDCWVPTARGWFTLFILALAALVTAARSANSFFSPNQPVAADVLVVEGWLPDDALRGAIGEFRHGHYKILLTSGGPSPDLARFSCRTWAEFAAINLAAMGLETNFIVAVPSGYSTRDRTYSSALAVRDRLLSTNGSWQNINVYSQSTHSRRARLLFQIALGKRAKVGILAYPDTHYNPSHWWTSSAGARSVVDEGLAYVYARFMFPFLASEGTSGPVTSAKM
jgi:hypothetical protein